MKESNMNFGLLVNNRTTLQSTKLILVKASFDICNIKANYILESTSRAQSFPIGLAKRERIFSHGFAFVHIGPYQRFFEQMVETKRSDPSSHIGRHQVIHGDFNSAAGRFVERYRNAIARRVAIGGAPPPAFPTVRRFLPDGVLRPLIAHGCVGVRPSNRSIGMFRVSLLLFAPMDQVEHVSSGKGRRIEFPMHQNSSVVVARLGQFSHQARTGKRGVPFFGVLSHIIVPKDILEVGKKILQHQQRSIAAVGILFLDNIERLRPEGRTKFVVSDEPRAHCCVLCGFDHGPLCQCLVDRIGTGLSVFFDRGIGAGEFCLVVENVRHCLRWIAVRVPGTWAETVTKISQLMGDPYNAIRGFHQSGALE
mmetsp:Transcript_22922/g.48326  ORF Transcript_22922/g.48326 Transcript_22922/m.48326 type:complete len:366 (+) Transcript_22922:72-1169(+)